MIPRIPVPRLLPITIAALAGLLAMKSVALVRAAVPVDHRGVTVVTAAAEKERSASAMDKEQPAAGAAAPADTAAGSAPAPPPVSDAEKTVLLELRHRRQELDAREAGMAARESMLAAAEQKISARVEELQTLQRRLEALEATRQQREDAGWQGLVKLYETMKPREAATIMNELAMPTLLQIVDRMKDAKAAALMAAMSTDKARDLTAQLAQMRTRHDTTAEATGGPGMARPPAGPAPPSPRTLPQGG